MLIAHRINSLEQLLALPHDIAIEFDVRDSAGELFVCHDPFVPTETALPLERFFQNVGRRFLIVNVKSEGIEYRVLELLKKYELENFFFLDCSFPMIIKLIHRNESRIAIRFSEYESIETVLALQKKVMWVWIDCFTQFPLTKDQEVELHKAGFRLCIVSPELQNQTEKRAVYLTKILKENIQIDAVCTKVEHFASWQPLFDR